MLDFTIKIQVIVTGRQSRERDVEMNNITVVERERRIKEKLAWSRKRSQNCRKRSQMVANVTNGGKRSQMIASSSKWSQMITNHQEWSEMFGTGRKRSRMFANGCRWSQAVANVLNVSNFQMFQAFQMFQMFHMFQMPQLFSMFRMIQKFQMFRMFRMSQIVHISQKVAQIDVQTLLLLEKSQLLIVEKYFFWPFLESKDFFVKPYVNPQTAHCNYFLIHFISRVNHCYSEWNVWLIVKIFKYFVWN